MSHPAHRYRSMRCATGTVTWCSRCGHVPLKNDVSRKVSEKGCWSWESKHKIERGDNDLYDDVPHAKAW